ncbi:MAG TPA: glycerol-3-phosphate dehydrogenase [Methyloversatilis sp.]
MASETCDLLIVGAGINGAGIARDAALRGLDVVVCERGDIAGATSSASTKLIHGGLRYLEQGAFGLVRESLQEREVLGRIAAHLVRPQRFIVPHTGERPAWQLALGMTLYDTLAGCSTLPRSERLPCDYPPLAMLRRPVPGAHAYYDLQVDDARLTLANLLEAHALGARVFTRCALRQVARVPRGWRCTLGGRRGEYEITARCVVNVAGPWMPEVEVLRGVRSPTRLRLVQGTHIILPRLHAGDDAWLLQHSDRRVVFITPWGARFHLVGTTETELSSTGALGVTAAERSYLLDTLTRAFDVAVRETDIRHEFCGMRPLIGGGGTARTASREYRLNLEQDAQGRGWMSVQGGKLTTYRRLAETAVDRLSGLLGSGNVCTTAQRPLPGSDGMTGCGRAELIRRLVLRWPGLAADWLHALVERHGTVAERLVREAMDEGGPGRDFGGGLCEAEARWCARHEWAVDADDVLWRRTRCGLDMTAAQRAEFGAWWDGQRTAGTVA